MYFIYYFLFILFIFHIFIRYSSIFLLYIYYSLILFIIFCNIFRYYAKCPIQISPVLQVAIQIRHPFLMLFSYLIFLCSFLNSKGDNLICFLNTLLKYAESGIPTCSHITCMLSLLSKSSFLACFKRI